MNRQVLFLLILFFNPLSVNSQNCNNNDFDFWIGKWEINHQILRSDGTWIELTAENTVKKEAGGCVVTENWEGETYYYWDGMEQPQKINGYSFRYFDSGLAKWKIYWVDSWNMELGEPYLGVFSNNTGEFFRKTTNGQSKISFVIESDTTISWSLSVLNPQNIWKTIWKMQMIKKRKI